MIKDSRFAIVSRDSAESRADVCAESGIQSRDFDQG